MSLSFLLRLNLCSVTSVLLLCDVFSEEQL